MAVFSAQHGSVFSTTWQCFQHSMAVFSAQHGSVFSTTWQCFQHSMAVFSAQHGSVFSTTWQCFQHSMAVFSAQHGSVFSTTWQCFQHSMAVFSAQHAWLLSHLTFNLPPPPCLPSPSPPIRAFLFFFSYFPFHGSVLLATLSLLIISRAIQLPSTLPSTLQSTSLLSTTCNAVKKFYLQVCNSY